MSQKTIRALLEGRLATWAAAHTPVLRGAWENTPFTPASGETYLRPFLLPADTEDQFLSGGHRGYLGVFQISITGPINVGSGAINTIAAEIEALFPTGLALTSGSVTVRVTTPPSIAPALQEPSSYTVPVSFTYRADVVI